MNSFFGQIYSRYGRHFPVGQIYERGYFARPFGKGTKNLLLLYCPRNPVSFSQIYPFLFYEKQVMEYFGISIRALSVEDYASSGLVGQADVMAIQTEFSVDEEYLENLFNGIRRQNNEARLVYLDWFAPLDLRFAEQVNPHIDLYVKRQVFRDPRNYYVPTLGDTNLMDYYSRLYNLADEERLFPIPADFFQKIVLGPGLLTGSYLLNAFAARQDLSQPKTLDLHARFACSGTPWYSAMRTDALYACKRLSGASVAFGNGVSQQEYLAELARSKMCFSPFGYGEVCWRDYEAALNGSLLLKPDMSHLKTDPDIFVNNETYVPLAWDYSDLEEKVEFYVNNDRERNRMVENARQALDDYVNKGGFIRQMGPVFQLAKAGSSVRNLHQARPVYGDWQFACKAEAVAPAYRSERQRNYRSGQGMR